MSSRAAVAFRVELLGFVPIRIENISDQRSAKLHARRVAGVGLDIHRIEIAERRAQKLHVVEPCILQINIVKLRT